MYKLEAVDTVIFREANSFDAGVHFHSSSKFPPYPATYAGVFKEGTSLKDRDIKIGFNGVMLDNEYAFPQPLDTVITQQNTLQKMKLVKSGESSHELPYTLSSISNENKKTHIYEGAYLKANDFNRYLLGDETYPFTVLGEYITRELHTGIKMDYEKHTTVEGMWYTEESIRLKSKMHTCALVAQVEGVNLQENSLKKIGANTRLVKINKAKELNIVKPKASRYFKVYFATPAIFKHGWLPRWINPDTKEGTFRHKRRKVRVKLIAAAIGKAVPIGGYSKNGPREMHLAIPAGSVYYFELLEGEVQNIEKIFHQKCISDFRHRLGFDYEWWDRLIYCDRGFGYTFVGEVKEEELR